MSTISVLIVDDEVDIRVNVKKLLERTHIRKVYLAGTIDEMMATLRKESIDVVLLDNHLGNNIRGSDYIEEIKKISNTTEVVMFTSDRNLDLIIKSIKSGAFYYLQKSECEDIEIVTLIKKAYDAKKISEDFKAISDAYIYMHENELKEGEMVSGSKYIISVKDKLLKLVKNGRSNSILFTGENGVGKTEFAKYCYSLLSSSEKVRPFFRVKCSSLNEDNFRETFYGSSNSQGKGILEMSNRAILSLEEIKDLKKEIQHLVLSLYKDKQFALRSGEKRDNKLIIISTTSGDLKQLLESGVLIKDLYYELYPVCFDIMPLRKRPDDILQLTNYFTDKFSKTKQTSFPPLPNEIIDLFLKYDWPGNVTELESVLEKLFVLGFEDGKYNINELPESILSKNYTNNLRGQIADGESSSQTLEKLVNGSQSYDEKVLLFKKFVVELSLKKNNYIVADTAKELGRNRTTIYREFKMLDIDMDNKLNK